MTDVRDAIAAALQQIHTHRLANGEYEALAARVNKHLNGILENCKLPPDVDRQLLLVLNEINNSLGEMRAG
jgi:hypothetical protein